MTQEEKAKAYDEAIERATQLSKQGGTHKYLVGQIFQELKESNDERIRRDIIYFLSRNTLQFGEDIDKYKSWIDWLEKQSGQPKKVSIWKHWKNGIAGNGEGTPVYLIKDDYTYSISSCLCFECDYIELSELDKLLSEKQSEQKVPVDDFKAKDWYVSKVDGKIHNIYYSVDKVEPKFRNGQWIVWQNKSYKVNNNGCGYELVDQNGLSTSLEYGTVEESAHLWDITKDAKDGDVLVSSSGKPFIFKGFFDNDPMAYGGLVADDSFWPASNSNWTTVYCKPATKEQRDLLFQKMKEAGYEWNAEKKELKKLDNKVEPKFHEGDWIISDTANKDYHICKITGIKDGNYTIESTCGYKGYNTFETFEKDYHIWTIKDSKNGDVLCSKKHNLIWIYKDNEHYHASINLNYADVVSFDNEIVVPSDVCPANRVQKSILFQKIEEAGYMWDAEKKELKKIEQKPTWTDYDEYVYNEILKRVEKKKLYEHDLEYIYNWLKFIKDRVGCEMNCTTTKQWSEEDEKLLKLSLENLTELKDRFGEEYGRVDGCINWLKSLRPQNWTKEDKERYISCLQRLGTGNPEQPETINSKWFKEHVYPKNTWKPSDEQMEVLQESIGIVGQLTPRGECLKELAEQLKKLKGE